MTTPAPDMPLVSVVITAYNFAEFLPITLNSVLMQTYPNMEVLLIDDGSTDNTAEVVAPFTDRITYIQQENMGIVNTYNKGISLAIGKYICVLDGDDYWTSPDKIEKQVAIMEANPAIDFVMTGWQNISDEGDVTIFADDFWDMMPDFAIHKWMERPPNQMQPLLLKRSVMNAIGGFNHFEYAADVDFFLSLVSQYNGTWLREVTTVHRVRAKSAGHANRDTQLDATFKILEKHLASDTMPEEIREQRNFFMFFHYLTLILEVCRLEIGDYTALASGYFQQSMACRWAGRDFDMYDVVTYLGTMSRDNFADDASNFIETLTHMTDIIKNTFDLPELADSKVSLSTAELLHWWLCIWWRYYHMMTPENRETPLQHHRITFLPDALDMYRQKSPAYIANLVRLSITVTMLNYSEQMITALDRFWHEMCVYEILQTRDRHMMVMVYTTTAIRALYFDSPSVAMKLVQRAWIYSSMNSIPHWLRFAKSLGAYISKKLTGRT